MLTRDQIEDWDDAPDVWRVDQEGLKVRSTGTETVIPVSDFGDLILALARRMRTGR